MWLRWAMGGAQVKVQGAEGIGDPVQVTSVEKRKPRLLPVGHTLPAPAFPGPWQKSSRAAL